MSWVSVISQLIRLVTDKTITEVWLVLHKKMAKVASLNRFSGGNRMLFPRGSYQQQNPSASVTSQLLTRLLGTMTVQRRSAARPASAEQHEKRHSRPFSVGPRRMQMSKEKQGQEQTQGQEQSPDIEFDSFAVQRRRTNGILFDLARNGDPTVPASVLQKAFRNAGLWKTDPRLTETTRKINYLTALAKKNGETEVRLDEETFRDCIKDSRALVRKSLTGDFVIPEFSKFCKVIEEIYWECRNNYDGQVASYIPQLAKYSPDLWGVSLCTVDGQRHAIGDVGVPFTLQSSSKPVNYALAVNELGPEEVHRYIGHEPSGESFNCIKLNPDGKPHNPMINPGAIVVSSLVKRDLSPANRFDFIMSQYRRIVGNEYLGFNNAVFLSEKETADRNFALGYYLQENHCFPEGSNLNLTMDLYFQLCSVEVNANSGAVIAATLANGGTCPITGDEVLSPDSVRNTLALMHSCGMYDYSGGFAFKVGLPAKSSVSGCILLVVPNVVGICLWSPPLERMGNSVRGVQFCEQLIQRFNFHPYDTQHKPVAHAQKTDPRLRKADKEADRVADLLFGAYNGDLTALRRMALSGQNMTATDYDGRTALHVASAEGHFECVRFLVEDCNVAVDAMDRWGCTPMDDAVKFNRHDIQLYLQHSLQEKKSQSDESA